MVTTFQSVALTVLVLVLFQFKGSKSEVVDVIKMIGDFQKITAILAPSSTAGDDKLECLRADLTQYDHEAKTGTYMWYLQATDGSEKAVQHNVSEGSSPDKVQVATSADPDAPFTASVPYTDYETCFILQTQEFGGQCLLWANDAFRNNVPQQCLSKYGEHCGSGVSLYTKECNAE